MYPLALVTGQIGENSYSIKQKKQKTKKQIKLIDFFHPNIVSVTQMLTKVFNAFQKQQKQQKHKILQIQLNAKKSTALERLIYYIFLLVIVLYLAYNALLLPNDRT